MLSTALAEKEQGDEVSPLNRILTWYFIACTNDPRIKRNRMRTSMARVLSLRFVCKQWASVVRKEMPHVWMHACSQLFPLWPLAPIALEDGEGWFLEISRRIPCTKAYRKMHKALLSDGALTNKMLFYERLKQMSIADAKKMKKKKKKRRSAAAAKAMQADMIFSDMRRLNKVVGQTNYTWITSMATGLGSNYRALKFSLELIRRDDFYLPDDERVIHDMLLQNTPHHKLYYLTSLYGGADVSLAFNYADQTGDPKRVLFKVFVNEDKDCIDFRCNMSRRLLPSGIDFRGQRGSHVFESIEDIVAYFSEHDLAKYPLCLRSYT